MAEIELSDDVHRRVRLLGRAWRVPDGVVVERLLGEFEAGIDEDRNSGDEVDVHVVYDGVRTNATFDKATQSVTIKSGPLVGQRFKSPSGAAVAVVRQAKPRVHAERNGWGFWIVTATGEPLQSLRR